MNTTPHPTPIRPCQRWRIVSPRQRLRHEFDNRPYLQAGPEVVWTEIEHLLFMPEKSSWNAWNNLVRSSASRRRRGKSMEGRSNKRIFLPGNPSKFETLPFELLDMILSHEDLAREDLISVGVASPNLWPHVLDVVAAHCKKQSAPFAGVEIACVGSSLQDLPPSFQADGLRKRCKIQQWHAYQIPIDFDRRCAWSRHTPVRGESYSCDCKGSWYNRIGFGAYVSRHWGLFNELKEVLDEAGEYDSDSEWMLRNLTTKEYIRCEHAAPVYEERANTRGYGYVLDTVGQRIRIDDILLMRICCTRYSGGMFNSLENGVWAGHCFDIVELNADGKSGNGKKCEWRDCTAEVVKEAMALERLLDEKVEQRGNLQKWKKRPSGLSWEV
ncbi:hypothetical protein EJ08DRAFT_725382 [Tothia fuscella]|uniref:Uncharacterized protein n=1 Tax=Tothia fuscella TaxID=1048955 RepID=A0A9P4U2E2_9PEZI|nr:hypothetical protein EJ08DRAFT_725382 [Tothia fuscella]